MKIVLAVTMFNEINYGPHVWLQMDDALEMGYDDIVVLDDGSTDGTWDVLQEYANKHNNIHVFRNEKNSILSKGVKRWKTLTDHCAKFDPTWINYRAADQIYCPTYKNKYREVVEWFTAKRCHLIVFPIVHLWRSETWYRADAFWGTDVRHQTKAQLWRFNKDYIYKIVKARFHQGGHFPAYKNIKNPVHMGINSYFGLTDKNLGKNRDFPFIIFHLGHTTHAKKVAKFRWTLEASRKGESIGVPSVIPPPHRWLSFNGYKGFQEFKMRFKQVNPLWYDGKPPEIEPLPVIEPLTDVIADYNKGAAKEYQNLYNKFILKK